MIYSIHTDGGARGNPGNAAIGVVIKQNEKLLTHYGKYIGFSTNNVAEYTAVKDALEYLLGSNQNRGDVQFFLDSELVVKQLLGIYKIKDEKLQLLAKDILQLIEKWGSNITFTHVKREQNKDADRLVNSALDAHT